MMPAADATPAGANHTGDDALMTLAEEAAKSGSDAGADCRLPTLLLSAVRDTTVINMSLEVFNRHFWVAPITKAAFDKFMESSLQLLRDKESMQRQLMLMEREHARKMQKMERQLQQMEHELQRTKQAHEHELQGIRVQKEGIHSASSTRAQRALAPMFTYAAIMQPSAPSKSEMDSDDSKSEEGYEITEEENDHTCDRKRKVCGTPKRQGILSMNMFQVHSALSTIEPILGVSKFRFVDDQAHNEFFDTIKSADSVFEKSTARVCVSPQQREKCGSKMLGCIGYTMKAGGSNCYEWVGHRALINGYRNCGTTNQLDVPTKTLVKDLAKQFPTQHVKDDGLEFREVTKDTAAREISRLCPLRGRMEGRKDLEFELVCNTLRSFHAAGKIVDLHRLQR